MRCPKCGNQVSAGAKFCRTCGARLMPLPASEQAAPAALAPVARTRFGGKKWLAAVVLVLALSVVAAYLLLGRKKGDNIDCFMVCDGNYVLADVQNDQAFPLVPSMGEAASVLFGPDESYVFLFMRNDILCRVDCAGLELDPEASNAGQVMQVDTGVFQNGVTQLTGGRAVYLKKGGELCWFDGQTVTRLAGNVVSYSLVDGEKLVYSVETENGYIIYWVPLDGSEKAAQLTGENEMAWLWSSWEAGQQAAYSVETEEGWEALYLVGADGEPQLVNDAAQIYNYGEMGDTLYYTADTTMPYDGESFASTGILCSLKDGAITQLAERVNNYWLNGDQLVYLVEDDLNQERAAADFSISDVREDPVCYHRCFVMADGLPTVEVDMDNLVEVLIQDGDDRPWVDQIMTNGTQVFVRKGQGNIYQAPVTDGIATGFVQMTEGSKWMTVNGDSLYYTDALPGGQNEEECSLYCARDGEIACLSESVNPWQVWVYEDGTVLAIRNLDTSSTAQGQLVMLNAAEGETLVGEKVSGFLRMDEETILYLSDGTLYRFRKGESEELWGQIEGLWCRNVCQPVYENDLYWMELSQ